MQAELSRPVVDGPLVPPADAAGAGLVRTLLNLDDVAAACRAIEADDERTLGEQRLLTEIPAPPFGEEKRAARMAELFDEAGLVDVERDGEGNVLGRLAASGRSGGAPLAVAAHLDTVFPAGTDVSVREHGDRLIAPGISDDGRGLAALLALARGLAGGGIAFDHPLLFVATVGEEGAGNLRGVRHLFEGGALAAGCTGFVSLDGAGLRRIVSAGLGSRRYRIRASGPGGHSWVDFGTINPIHVLGRAVAALADMPLPDKPATTLSVGRWSGGTSVNAIPRDAWFEFEIRSVDGATLDAMDARALERLRGSVAEEGSAEGPAGPTAPAGLRLEIESIGYRPPGRTPVDSELVRAAAAATRALDIEPELAISSTDANVPMAADVPAITLGAGGEAGGPHTPDEWYRNVRGPAGVVRALITLLAVDGRRGRLDGATSAP